MKSLQCAAFILLLLGVCYSETTSNPLLEIINKNAIVDDCCCKVGTVLESNAKDLNPLLVQLAKTRFFKYFKLDLFSTCPFWACTQLCGLGGCAINECDNDEVPTFWDSQKTDLVSVETPENFVSWKDLEENMWTIQGREEDMSYVNLDLYPESFTGYKEGNIIWNRIYQTKCFQRSLDEMCLEERVMYKLISGMHASINVHIATNYEKDEATGQYKSQPELYFNTVGKHPDRIQNLFFIYLFLLRAVHRAGPVLSTFDFQTGNIAEDAEVKNLMKQLLATDLLCSPNFDETILFSGQEKEALKKELKQTVRNISLIMNCVTCEKCKVYAKLQTLALGTALKILLEPESALKNLQRNEIIALLNTLRKFSSAIVAVSNFEKMRPQFEAMELQKHSYEISLETQNLVVGMGFALVVLMLSFKCSSKTSKQKHE